ncbi:2-isopropylmalate synthase [Candidatus Uhrbacteria bacterium CG10_big_fil_rev_8_21_14_0_10_48_11]|uniref:2-isopropylmalate synthase n=1 Tax=Candidatus Uhrbacteria bacterium CG10_big_fil_rev_8_21_14_0_10_48_11 TaxID=1975037 RepID=A0A2M8LDY9_9BACT|nr:MAG: 2-isopropylmalate synthase [Candidatus Uhrbacteria bacterium CG10_big_fil_rev_8_21_14_0_10_48_11]
MGKYRDGSNDWVRIFDTTLRDGEQSPGCTMNVDEKLAVARQLEALGVDVIEAGFAAASPGDLESVKAVARAVDGPVVLSLARTREADIETALRAVDGAKSPGIHVFIATSDIHLRYKLGMSRQEVIDAAAWAVERASRYVDYIEFSAEDASRSDTDYLCQVFGEVIRAGARVCNVPDTTGYGVPDKIRQMFETLRARTESADQVIWSTHCHNDLGLAVANSLAAVEGGARQVECTINGIGERAGNTALEEVVMALNTRYDHFVINTRVNAKQIYLASQTLSKMIGMTIAPTKPIVGANAFAHEAGIHQDGVLKNVRTYEIMRPEDVGRISNTLVLGKHSGRHAFSKALRELGFDPRVINFSDAFTRFKLLADKKGQIFSEDLIVVAIGDESDASQRFVLEDVRVVASLHGDPEVAVTISIDGKSQSATATGDGLIDACYEAIKKSTYVYSVLEGYQAKGLTGGTDALGEVSVLIRTGEIAVRGRGNHTDVVMASALAYVDAINRLELVRLVTTKNRRSNDPVP